MNWHIPSDDLKHRADIMRASIDPLNSYPTLDIYKQRSTSHFRRVIMNTQTPPQFPNGGALPKHGSWSLG